MSKKDKKIKNYNNNASKNDDNASKNDDNENTDDLEKRLLKNNLIYNKKEILIHDETKNNLKKIDNKNINKNISTINPFIQNEVIWYSHDLDSEELEKKFKNRTTISENKQLFNMTQNLENNENFKELDSEELEKKFKNRTTLNNKTNNKSEKQILTEKNINNNCIKCTIPCKKINSNIYEWNYDCNINYELFNKNTINIGNIYCIKNDRIYYPKMIEFFIDDIFIKKMYSDIMNNDNTKLKLDKNYIISDDLYLLTLNSTIKINIHDENDIDNVFIDIILQSNKKLLLEYSIYSHELLYEGINSDITIKDLYGYFYELIFVCDNIYDFKSITLLNTDNTLLKDVPVQLLDYDNNIFIYSLKTKIFENIILSGLKIDENNYINIKFNKYNQCSNIKIYGNKKYYIKL